ncbi:uncharacterized protein BcabD6B2_54090 [Babesia caballi]|uniref:Uncharacterized protein n=1 Tax=Babesia caballi TaxID=5871 RepID=A0AAV4M1W6_BABCB|nr:hypothetical protein BcabD6B2_54090 [Babesia caballi]
MAAVELGTGLGVETSPALQAADGLHLQNPGEAEDRQEDPAAVAAAQGLRAQLDANHQQAREDVLALLEGVGRDEATQPVVQPHVAVEAVLRQRQAVDHHRAVLQQGAAAQLLRRDGEQLDQADNGLEHPARIHRELGEALNLLAQAQDGDVAGVEQDRGKRGDDLLVREHGEVVQNATSALDAVVNHLLVVYRRDEGVVVLVV